MKTIKGHDGLVPSTDYRFYEGPLGRVTAVGRRPNKKILDKVHSIGDTNYFLAYVSTTAINTKDLDEAEKFSRAILAACKKARQLNKKLGL